MPLPASPAFLALTWISWWAASVGLGWLLSGRRSRDVGVLGWFGLFLVTAVSMFVGLLLPLDAPVARIIAWLLLVIGVIAFMRAGMWRRWRLLILIAAITVTAALLSSVVPSNYDLGLYHAGSIAYVRDGGTVIGLANLHDRFGFSSSMWPMSALLGLGLWNGDEFRLVNGLLVALLFADVLGRVRAGRARRPATVVLTAGAVLLAGAVIQYPGRLIASSAQDWAMAVFVVVSATYLIGALTHRRRHVATVAILTSAMAGAMRPTGWLLAVTTVAVLVWFNAHASNWRTACGVVAPGVVGGLALGTLTAVRDALTSGWLLFPAKFAPVPVAWRYPDPAGTSQAITAWARTPFQDPGVTFADSSWILGWVSRLPTDWAFFSALVLLVVLLVWVVTSSAARAALIGHRRLVALTLLPSMVVLVAWLITAPDPRFAWGPLLLIAVVPLGVLIPTIGRHWVWPATIALGVLVIVAVALARGSVFDATLRLQPMPAAQVERSALGDGTPVVVPINGDQCWGVFPLCRPWYAGDDVELRGETWLDGFHPRSRLKDSQE